jgi:hypothetical protein
MQDDVVFPKFGIDPGQFWKKCNSLVHDQKWDGELAYMKCLLDYLGMDRVTNAMLTELGAGLSFFPGLPELFEALPKASLRPEHELAGIKVEHYIISSGLKALLDGSRLKPYVREMFGCEFGEDADREGDLRPVEAFVVMGPSGEDGHRLPAPVAHDQATGVAEHAADGEARDVRVGDRHGFGQCLGDRTETGPEHDSDAGGDRGVTLYPAG